VIPVFEPEIDEDDIQAVVAALRRGELSGSFGESLERFEREFAEYVGVRHGVAVSSGTAALHLAIAALDLTPDDEVLMSASTNVATALAAYHNRLISVPVDSETDTWNLDLTLIESLVTSRTRAIIPVHLFGHPVDMPLLLEIAERHGLVVIEDCAESHGATCNGQMTGSFGRMGCFSFYANKVITTGEGGMVVTDDSGLADRLRTLRNLAFTTPRFKHDLAGFNFRMTAYQAAMGVSQLSRIERTIERKREIADLYNKHLSGIDWLRLPSEKDWARHVYWMYAVVVDRKAPVSRDGLAEWLREAGIDTRTFFCPIGQQPFLQREGLRETACPVADTLWESGLYLPSSVGLDDGTIERIAMAIRSITE
jgi:perosamine synthetase